MNGGTFSLTTLDVDHLSMDELVPALGAIEALRAKILGRILPPPVAPLTPHLIPTRGAPSLTVRQVSERLRVSQAWVRRAIQSGRLAHFKIGSRNIRIPESAVAKLERGVA
jgi:excisionase family DNA binding protein